MPSGSERSLLHRFRDSDQRTPLVLPGSPFAARLETTILGIDVPARTMRLAFHADAHYTAGPRDTIQGGALATMLDLAMVYLVIALTPAESASATANLNVSYLKPAMAGRIDAEAHIERLGRTLGFARATLRNAAGDAVATATGTFSIFDRVER